MVASVWFSMKFSLIFGPIFVCETLQCIGRFVLYKLNEEKKDSDTSRLREQRNDSGNPQSMIQSVTLYIVVKVFLVVQGLLVVLRVDNLITWEWLQVLWVTWVVVAFLFGLSFGIFCVFIIKFIGSVVGKDPWKESTPLSLAKLPKKQRFFAGAFSF